MDRRITLLAALLALLALACRATAGPASTPEIPRVQAAPTATPLPPMPVQPGEANPDEPVFITGEIPYTSPFFLQSIAEPFVLLEDEAGFVRRDEQFQFKLEGQAIGPVSVDDEKRLTYSLALPSVPQGTLVDVDNDGETDTGVQVFAVAYWSNTWGGPFLEERDGYGWSTAYTSTIVDPDQENEIVGGLLVVWSPDGKQGFPSGFGDDGQLFTADDPTDKLPEGYSLVNLDQQPFLVYKEARPVIPLIEGDSALNDYSDMSYGEAFQALFDKVSAEYPFTEDKHVDWATLRAEFEPRAKAAGDDEEFYKVLRDFTYAIPDSHAGLSINGEVFFAEHGGGLGLIVAELSDGRVIAREVLKGLPAERAGMPAGAVIETWDGAPTSQAIDKVMPDLGSSHSTAHALRLEQAIFLTRMPPGTRVDVTFRNPKAQQAQKATLKAEPEYDSLTRAITSWNEDELSLPVEARVLDESGLGYIKIPSFLDDYSLMARLWERALQKLVDLEAPGLIIDLRSNSGGSGGLALSFAGYFFKQEIPLYQGAYYNERTGEFQVTGQPARILPGPFQYTGPVAVLVSPECVSACEGFAYALTQDDRSIVVGSFPTAGAFGEVGRGQYTLPGDISMQFPTGRPETLDGTLLIEGAGVAPDITVPVTEASVMGAQDTILDAAIQALLDKIK